MDEFLFHILSNTMKRGATQTSFLVKTHLVVLTSTQAGHIARSFVMLLMSNATGAHAVDEYITMYPALGDLDRE